MYLSVKQWSSGHPNVNFLNFRKLRTYLAIIGLSSVCIFSFQNCGVNNSHSRVDEFSSVDEVQEIKGEIESRESDRIFTSSGSPITRSGLSCGINDIDPRDVADIDFDRLIENRMGAAAKVWSSNRSGPIKTFKLCSSIADSPFGIKPAVSTKYGAPVWIISDRDRVIHLEEMLLIKRSHRVIDGRGANITFKGHGLQIKGVTDVIIHNVGVKHLKYPYSLCAKGQSHIDEDNNIVCCKSDGDSNRDWPDGQDGINVRNSDRVWIDHVLVQGVPDEAITVTHSQSPTGQNRTTISHSKILNRRNPICADGYSEGHGIMIGCAASEDPELNCFATEVSVIRNYFDVDNRTPFIWGGAKAHAVNNRVDKPSDWFSGAKEFGRLYSGANWYQAATYTNKKQIFHFPDQTGCGVESKDVGLNGVINNERDQCSLPSIMGFYEGWGTCSACRTYVKELAGRKTDGVTHWTPGSSCTASCRW